VSKRVLLLIGAAKLCIGAFFGLFYWKVRTTNSLVLCIIALTMGFVLLVAWILKERQVSERAPDGRK
jgi:hypothetical protein